MTFSCNKTIWRNDTMDLQKFRKQIKSSNGKSRCYIVYGEDDKTFKDIKNLRSKQFDVEKIFSNLLQNCPEIQKILKE